MKPHLGRANPMDIFITRPILAVVISLVLTLAGLEAARSITVIQFPEIESATLIIKTPYVGASAETVQGFITDPIERVAATVPGVDYVSSVTSPGLSIVNVWLKLNEDSTSALAEMTARLNQIRFELPADAEDPAIVVERADRSNALMYLDVMHPGIARINVTDYLNRNIIPALGSVEGVQMIEVQGGRNPAIRAWIDPVRLAALNLSTQDIENALRSNNVLAAIGRTENDDQRYSLLTNTTMKTAADFEALVIKASDGVLIRLGDIARIELGEDETQEDARLDQENTVYLGVYPLPGVNEIAVADGIYDVLDNINPTLPTGLRVGITYDETRYMRDSIREIFTTLAETILLVGIVVIALMGSIRTALVPLITIPISLLGAVAIISMVGFSLNLLTILAIVLSVGLVVDDAIVVVENVSRHMREGMSRIDAALTSSRQLMSPIIGMTITLAAVYAPIGFLSGLTGVLFKEFVFTLSIAVLISGIVALTLSPIMSAYTNPEGGEQAWLTKWVNRRFDLLHQRYGRLLRQVIESRNQVIAAAIFFSLLALPFSMFSQKELAPTEDESMVFMLIEAPPNASLEYTGSGMSKVVDRLMAFKEATQMWQIFTPEGGIAGLLLSPPDQREQSAHALLPQVYAATSEFVDVKILPLLRPALPSAGRFDVELAVLSTDPLTDMKPYLDQLMQTAMSSGKFLYVDTDLKIDLPEVELTLDRERISDLGMSLDDVAQQLSVFLSGNYINRFDLNGRAYRVIPMIEDQSRSSPHALLDLQIRTPAGQLIPLSTIARLKRDVAPRVYAKFQQKNAFRVMGGLIPGTTKEQGLAVLEQAASEILPKHYSIDYAGESRQIRNEGNTLGEILTAALIFVYLVLAILFNNFRDPLVVLIGSVPLALSGALMLTFFDWTTINIYSQIGFITLVGLVAKNGILIVEFANHLQSVGKTKLDAIQEAAETRLRPVLMTTAATVLGHFPLVLVSGAGAEARNSIGIILVAGMTIGTLFTLFVLPCVYLLLAHDHQPPSKPAASATE